jgi:hypothetical protein
MIYVTRYLVVSKTGSRNTEGQKRLICEKTCCKRPEAASNHATTAYFGRWDITPLILELGTMWT